MQNPESTLHVAFPSGSSFMAHVDLIGDVVQITAGLRCLGAVSRRGIVFDRVSTSGTCEHVRENPRSP